MSFCNTCQGDNWCTCGLTDAESYTVPINDTPQYALQVNASDSEPVLAIKYDGRILWKNREIETDDEFRAAMLEVRDVLSDSFLSTNITLQNLIAQNQRKDAEIAALREALNREEPQPEYCDCEGFHNGSCQGRHIERMEKALKEITRHCEDSNDHITYCTYIVDLAKEALRGEEAG